MRQSVGDILAERYELREELSHSSPASAAFRAFDRDVEVDVALWVIPAALFAGAAEEEAFLRAVLEVRSIHHPNLRRLFDAGRIEDAVYITGQLSSTESLLVRLQGQEPGGELDVMRYAEAMCGALDAAHALGHCHGLLVPGEVVHVAGQVKIGGVGLWQHGSPDRAVAALAADSTRYIAPEVRGGAMPTPASDWYSVAAILTELAAGVCNPELGRAREVLQQRNPDLWTVLENALADDPAERPASGGEFLQAIREVYVDAKVPTTQRPAENPPPDADLSFGDEDDDDETRVHEGGAAGPVGFDPSFAAGIGGYEDEAEPPPIPDAMVSEEPPTAEERPSHKARLDSEDFATVDIPAGAPPDGDETVVDLAPPTGEPVRLDMVSMKSAESRPSAEHPTPLVDKQDGIKPVLRHVESIAPRDTGDLGTIAPPREARRPTSYWLWLALALAGGALVATLVLLLTESSGDDSAGAVDAGSPRAPAQAAAPQPIRSPRRPCSPGMVLLEEHALCVDRYESPGKGRLPQTGISLEDAQAQCARRKLRLCTAEEWELACRGEGGASWPYGDAHRPELCNVAGDIEAAGSHAECVGPAGIADMSGNVAEWVAEGQIRGGSAVDGSEGRCSQHRPKAARQKAYSDVGFRCCANALAPAEALE
jgi:hypothetical protein